MSKYLGIALALAALIAVGAAMIHNNLAIAQATQSQSKPPATRQAKKGGAVWTPDGKMKRPTGYREWVFLGAPVTPNALNNGKASFPEFHNVYVEKANFDAYQKTGTFPEGTLLVKELVLDIKGTYPDGSRDEPSGRGYFEGEFNGIDASVKDKTRFAGTNGWATSPSAITPSPMSRLLRRRPRANVLGATSPMSLKRT